MKRRIILVLALMLVFAALVVPTRPVKACDWCMTITYEQAHAACYAMKQNHYSSCRILGGSYTQCLQEADHIFDGCMKAHGF